VEKKRKKRTKRIKHVIKGYCSTFYPNRNKSVSKMSENKEKNKIKKSKRSESIFCHVDKFSLIVAINAK
jgi:hypothetical protein